MRVHCRPMARGDQIQGDLQAQIMRALWRLDRGTVEQVRSALPRRHRGAYTTIQTVLNRLAERGLVQRKRDGRVIVYSPRLDEAAYLSRTLNRALAGASSEARRAALANLVGELDPSELGEIRTLAREINRRRG